MREETEIEVFVFIYTLPWPVLMLFIPVMFAGVALLEYIFKKAGIKSRPLWDIFFAAWMIVILMATLHRQSAEVTSGSFQPLFQSYLNARSNPEVYRANFLNVVLFFPSGLFLWSLLPDRWSRAACIIISVLFFAGMSFVIELAQLYFHLGLAEADDVMHNTMGGLLGAIGAMVITALLQKRNSLFIGDKLWRR